MNEHENKKRRVALYIRVSTAEQKLDGYGLEAQENRLIEFVRNSSALKLETKKTWLYSDTHTGSDLNRENLNRLRADVKAGKFDAVLVWKIDRLSRSLKHLLTIFEEFQENDVSFISIQENIDFRGPFGSLVFQIFGAIAQFERELIKGRTLMGKIASAEMGNFTGTDIPYGYRPLIVTGKKGKKIETISDEKKCVEQMYDWYIYEGLGDGQIAEKLNALSVPSQKWQKDKETGVWRRGENRKWTGKMVNRILIDPLYRGEFIANNKDDVGEPLPEEKWTIVTIPPCVSEFTFQQAQEVRGSRIGGRIATEYLLSGKLIDMNLQRPKRFVGAKRYKGGFSYRRKQYIDKEGVRQPVFEIPGQQMEDFVWGKVLDALKKPDVFVKHYLSKELRDQSRIDNLELELVGLREQRMNNELAIARIEHAYEEGGYDEEKMHKKVSERNEDTIRIEQRIQDIEDQLRLASSIDVEVQKLKDAAAQVKYRLEKLDHKQKKILCQLFVDRVEMRRRRLGKRWKVMADIYFKFNPQRFTEGVKRVCTSSLLQEANKKKDTPKIRGIGGPGWS